MKSAPTSVGRRIRKRVAVIALVGLGAVAVAMAADVVHRAATGAEGSSLIDVLAQTQTGRLALLRAVFAAVLAGMWGRVLRVDTETRRVEQASSCR